MKPTDGRGLNNLLAQGLNNIPSGQKNRGVIARFNIAPPPFVNPMLERGHDLFRHGSVTQFRNKFLKNGTCKTVCYTGTVGTLPGTLSLEKRAKTA